MKKKVARKAAKKVTQKKSPTRARKAATSRVLAKMKPKAGKVKAAAPKAKKPAPLAVGGAEIVLAIRQEIRGSIRDNIEGLITELAKGYEDSLTMHVVRAEVGVIRNSFDPTFLKELMACSDEDLVGRTIDKVPAVAIRGLLALVSTKDVATDTLNEITSDDGTGHSDPINQSDDPVGTSTVDDDEL